MTLKSIETEYIELRQNLAEMSNGIIKMIFGSVEALTNCDTEKAEKIILLDNDIDKLDIKIDEICTKIIALYEPKASDLRYIITALRIIVDLERVGDHCKKICKQSIKLSNMPKTNEYNDIPYMANIAANMIKDSINAYFSKDENLAKNVILKDDEIDLLQKKITNDLILSINNDTTYTKQIIKLINILRRIERIADHAKNIAELVSFMVTGQILRHKK